MAVWLRLEDATDLFCSSMDPSTLTWDVSGAKTEDVVWQDRRSVLTKLAGGEKTIFPEAASSWHHEVVFIPRRCGGSSNDDGELPTHCFCVHRLTLLEDKVKLNRDLVARALEWESKSNAGIEEGTGSLDSSNVNGFHSGRSIENWRQDRLPLLLKEALGNVHQLEKELQKLDASRGVGVTASGSEEDELVDLAEIWLNVSRSGAWSILHTHPGSRWSGSYYVSDGGALSHGGGQLMLLPTAPPQLAAHHHAHMLPLAAACIAAGSSLSERRDHNELYFLQVPPTPGSMIVFPSFVPHFVLPCHTPNEQNMRLNCSETGSGCNQVPPRISVAFNVG